MSETINDETTDPAADSVVDVIDEAKVVEADSTEAESTEADSTEADSTAADVVEADSTAADSTEAGPDGSDAEAAKSGDTGSEGSESEDTGSEDSKFDDNESEGSKFDDNESEGSESDDNESEGSESDDNESEGSESDDTGSDDTESDDTDGLVDPADLPGALEAVLLVVDSPVTELALAAAVGYSVRQVTDTLVELQNRYTEAGSGIELRQVGGGWRFYTRDRFAPVAERFVLDGQQTRLSRAALETLAVIAYRQPVTRARIGGIRGVNVDGVIRTLVARGLAEEVGHDADTGGLLYATTELFLERLGLSGLEDLPSLGPLLPEIDALDDV